VASATEASGVTAYFVLVLISCAAYLPIVLPEQLGDDEPPTALRVIRRAVVIAPVVFAIAGTVLSTQTRWARVAGGIASRDATAVEIRRPAREFCRQMSDQVSPEPA
jgi:hypothetical protein